jgi:hypothetical protein
MDEDYDFSDTYHKDANDGGLDPNDEDNIIDYSELERTGNDKDVMADPTTIRERIDTALETLATLKQRRDTTVSRSDIVDRLAR